MASARKMIAAAAKAKRLYAVIQNRRYDANIQRVQKTVKSGALGPVTEIHADFFIGAHFGGFRDAMDYPLILDMAIHTFDQARFITGADPVSAYCHSFNPKGSWYKGDAAAMIIFEMTGGIVFGYRGSWCAEGLRTSWQAEWRVIGRKGSLKWDGEKEIKAEAVKPKGKPGFFLETEPVQIPEVKVEHGGHAGLIREFMQCVRSGKKPQTICTDNVKSLAMVLAAVKSAETGKTREGGVVISPTPLGEGGGEGSAPIVDRRLVDHLPGAYPSPAPASRGTLSHKGRGVRSP